MKLIEDTIISENLRDKIWLVSHGGVGSEYLTQQLNTQYPIFKIGKRPFKGCIAHFPYPVKSGPKLCIYIYGDIYNSIISQIPRHYDNPIKLHNNENYPEFHTIKDLVDYPSDDPFGITKQIKNFMKMEVDYPIILLKYPLKKSSIEILETLLQQDIEYEFKERESKLDSLDYGVRNKLIEIYKNTNNIIENIPDIIIRYPKSEEEYSLGEEDVINYEIKSCGLPGNRHKHFMEIDGVEVYNDRDISNFKTQDHKKNKGYGALRIKLPNMKEWKIKEFKDKLLLNTINGGIEDPRMFKYNKEIFVLMNGITRPAEKDLKIDNRLTKFYKTTKNPLPLPAPFLNLKREMYLYNLTQDTIVKLGTSNFDLEIFSAQKNWTPYIYKNDIYFIYSFNELCVLKITDLENGECEVIKGNPLNHNDDIDYFGSTPLIPWNFPYYIGFAHSRDPWLPIPLIYNVETMEIIKKGKLIEFTNHPDPPGDWRNNGKKVQFPYDLQVKDGKIILGVEFEDKCPTWLSIDYIGFCKQFSL